MYIYLMLIESEDDKIKFVKIYEAYKRRMHFTASSILKDDKEAEDIVHDTFVTLIDHLDNINEIESPRTWNYIVTILKNKCYNYIKRRKRVDLREDDIIFESTFYLLDTMDDYFIKKDIMQFLAYLVENLKYPYKEVICLQYYNKMNSKEIGKILEMTPENVRKIASRARNQLKNTLLEKGYQYE